jgi:hypothetical protein
MSSERDNLKKIKHRRIRTNLKKIKNQRLKFPLKKITNPRAQITNQRLKFPVLEVSAGNVTGSQSVLLGFPFGAFKSSPGFGVVTSHEDGSEDLGRGTVGSQRSDIGD